MIRQTAEFIVYGFSLLGMIALIRLMWVSIADTVLGFIGDITGWR